MRTAETGQARRVGRTEHELARGGPRPVELAGQAFGGTVAVSPVEPLAAASQADPVALQAVAKPGLSHRAPLLQLVDELHYLSQPIGGEARPEAGTHRAQQQAAEAGA